MLLSYYHLYRLLVSICTTRGLEVSQAWLKTGYQAYLF